MDFDWRKDHPPQVTVKPDSEALMEYIAVEFLNLSKTIIKEKGQFLLILGGGRTPRSLNKKIKEKSTHIDIDWTKLLVFFSDERCVPPEHKDSNFRMIRNTLIRPLNIPLNNVFRIEGEQTPQQAAEKYEKLLRGWIDSKATPCFDLALLGIGEDCHTASLFPGINFENEPRRLVTSVGKGPDGHERVSLTPHAINKSQNIWFMISGGKKRNAVRSLLEGEWNPLRCPSQLIKPLNGDLKYMMDTSSRGKRRIKEKEVHQ